MASTTRVRVFVHDRKIAEMGLPGGVIYRDMHHLIVKMEALAVTLAPKRTHRLANTITSSITPVGRRHIQGSVRARAPYAQYVIRGTKTPIRPERGRYLRLPVRGGSHLVGPFVYKRKVRGQRANDFLTKAMKGALRAHYRS